MLKRILANRALSAAWLIAFLGVLIEPYVVGAESLRVTLSYLIAVLIVAICLAALAASHRIFRKPRRGRH